jgi:hypothetical protein
MLDKFKYLSAAIIILAVLFKLQHLQGSGIMLTVGCSFLALYCILKIFVKE